MYSRGTGPSATSGFAASFSYEDATDFITQFNPAIVDHGNAIPALELIATEIAQHWGGSLSGRQALTQPGQAAVPAPTLAMAPVIRTRAQAASSTPTRRAVVRMPAQSP